MVGRDWEEKLKGDAKQKESLEYLDVDSAYLFEPLKTWTQAGSDSTEVKKATIVNWMQLGVYKTRERLFQYKNIKSDLCLA